ncbi:MAG: hypothetical protein CVU29_10135 [Betaproteobacteria bacterium HGW-Betaproteobacteria-22]|nr:MAG: hypothetical protein CVU29_10135 [Betaproteobacteria bacterium HGW-Betaproteobacteria-22]
MFWFKAKKQLQDDSGDSPREPFYQGRPDLLDLSANDAQLRVWLPEQTRLVMDRAVKSVDATLSEYLREFFVVYLYGSDLLLQMKQTNTGIFFTPPPRVASDVKYSRSRLVEYIPELGKNIKAIKIFLNAQIKADLQKLADKTGFALSHFVREVLISHFSGHIVWPERQVVLSSEHISIATQWENEQFNPQVSVHPSYEEESALEGVVEIIHL